ncbi:MAG: VRR-NUC domain-containing protein [Firmicutes bacterium]|nr:VRR-NUC domain-containing protein [Bacillota bacterium]
MRESDIAAYLVKRVAELGGIYRKVAWEGRSDAPDYLVMLNGDFAFVETKAPTGKPRPSQLREFAYMDEYGGETVLVVRTFEEVDTLMCGFRYREAMEVCFDRLTYRRFLNGMGT